MSVARIAASQLTDLNGRAPSASPGHLTLNRQTLTLLASLWLATLGNAPFWRAVWQDVGGLRADNFLFLLTLPLLVLAWVHLLLSLLAWGRIARAVLCAALLGSAVVSYFTYTYGMLLDHSMIANVVQTHVAEAQDLASWRMLAWLLLLGALPVLMIARASVTARPWRRELRSRTLGITVATACMSAIMLVNYQHYASLLRNHRELRLMLVPHNIVAAMYGHVRQRIAAPVVLQAVGMDAVHAAAATHAGKPTLTMVVIGETARAANFSLNGYQRPTNPELTLQNVISYPDVSSCGTSTAVSLPCMFLDVGRERYQDTLALRREGLLDVLRHAGIAVHWRDNNSGCKDVCVRVSYEDLSNLKVPGLCSDGECHDEILLHGLQERIDGLVSDSVIVLHMHGSHGPAYYKRYPPAFEFFKPVCDTVQLDHCLRQDIVNAYDNSLRYTDHVLNLAIELLRSNARRFDTAMLYVSDHGESLGENGLYLHGIPYALAPREQTRVPMLLWLSKEMSEHQGIDIACLKARRRDPLSHDYLFHSVLGLSKVQTSVYRPERDLFNSCRS